MPKHPKQYWLMKTEPDAFGIDDLARVRIEPWTGVRNYQARNFMRDHMHVADEVLFYHSSTEPPGVAGLARIHRTGVVDDTQFDPRSKYYDPGSKKDEPRWICVEVAFVEKFAELIPLAILREHPVLQDMVLLRKGSRLSVQPVTAAEFKIIAALSKKKPKQLTVRAAARAAARR